MLSDDMLDQIVDVMNKHADNLRLDAAYGGEWGDRGASTIKDEIEVFNAGRQRKIPKKWKEIVATATRESDPEWIEYQRLAKKFKNA